MMGKFSRLVSRLNTDQLTAVTTSRPRSELLMTLALLHLLSTYQDLSISRIAEKRQRYIAPEY